MKTDGAYSVDSILQRFMEKIPLKSFSEQYLRDHYICFSVVESIKADYSVAVITEQDYVDLNALNGFSEPVHKSSYVGLNTNKGFMLRNTRHIHLRKLLKKFITDLV